MLGMLTACSREKKEDSLIVWYTQADMQTYLENAAVQYKRETGITVTCRYCDSLCYLNEIHDTGIDEKKDAPDVYLLRHDKLEQACMKGLAAQNVSETYTEKNYCETALESASYDNKRMAYPLYYNTTCMIYNTDYFAEAPATMGAITAFSETAEIAENVQNILYWDISDYFCNYPFIGAYMDVASALNDNIVRCLEKFQNLGQYFAIDSETIDKEDVPAALMEGRTLCILADSDMVHVVNWYASNHGVDIPYRISAVPDVSDELESREGSYTELAVVNAMGYKQDMAADFAEFITSDYVHNLYWQTGHFPAKEGVEYENSELSQLYEIYKQSKQFPMMIEAEDIGIHLELLFSNVWNGADIATELKSFADKLELRLN